MIQIYEGNDTFTYTLSSGKELTLTQDELKELTGHINVRDEYEQIIWQLKKELRYVRGEVSKLEEYEWMYKELSK